MNARCEVCGRFLTPGFGCTLFCDFIGVELAKKYKIRRLIPDIAAGIRERNYCPYCGNSLDLDGMGGAVMEMCPTRYLTPHDTLYKSEFLRQRVKDQLDHFEARLALEVQ